MKSRSNSRSKNRQKDAKYISAAIIPSAAFIANPIVPSGTYYSGDSRNSLLSNTLKSSVSQEFNDKDCVIDEMKKISAEYKTGNLYSDFSNVKNESISNSKDPVKKKKKLRKSRSENRNHKDSKRHIEIANGLHIDQVYTPSNQLKIEEYDEVSITGSHHRISTDKLSNNYEWSSGNLNSDLHIKDQGIIGLNPENINDVSQNMHKRTLKIGFQNLENNSVITNKNQTSRISDEIHDPLSENIENPYDDQITTISNESEFQTNLMQNLYNKGTHVHLNRSFTDTHEIEPEAPQIGFIIEDMTNKQMKAEIRLLQDTIYRLNMELSEKISNEEEGNTIGKTIFPGKGPFPSWLMNTKYLAPLFLCQDKKFQVKCAQIQKMEIELKHFENEIRQVIKENERLYLKVQENQKGGPLSNTSDWQVIVQQAKLVIEENRLLLEKLDLQQQKFEVLEKNYSTEMAQMKKSLLSATSERDALDEEINNLTRKMAEMKSEMQHRNQSSVKQVSDQQQMGSTNDVQLQFYEHQFEEMKKLNRKLEQEVEVLKENEKKQSLKLEKYKKVTESEKKFRDYFNNILEKSDEVLNDRNHLVESLEKHNIEIKRLINKLTTEINCRTDIDMNEFEKYKCKRHKEDDNTQESLYTFESWIEILIQNYVDLMEKCKNHEEDVCKYQKLLNEKNRYLEECQQYNDELERKVETILSNQVNDSR